MKRVAIVFGNGTYEHDQFYLDILKEHPKALIVASDGGYNFLKKHEIKPNLIIGDLDSIEGDTEDIKVLKYPPEKDETDTELVLKYLTNRNYKIIFLVGMLSLDRIDHSLSNLLLLEKYSKEGIRVILANENNQIFCMTGPKDIKLSLKKGTIISLIPISQKVEDVSLKGFKYSLNSTTLSHEAPGLTISNVVTGKRQFISFKKGVLLLDILK